MGYKVIYGREKDVKPRGTGFRRLTFTVGFFALFLQCVSHYWPEGGELIQNLLHGDKMLEAAQVFSQELGSGFSLPAATRNFCIAIAEYGNKG